MKETHKLLQEKKKNKNKINACVEEMYNGLLNARGDQSRNTTQSLFDEDEASQMGKYRKRFAQVKGGTIKFSKQRLVTSLTGVTVFSILLLVHN